MANWFGLFSAGPRCSSPGCECEVTPAEKSAYTILTTNGLRHYCEDCWAEIQPRAERPSVDRTRVRRDPRSRVS